MLRRSKLSIFSTKLQYRWIFRKIAPNIIQDKIISSCKLQFVLKREKKREKIISTTIHSHVKFSSPNRLARNFLQVAASLASIPIEIPKSVFPVHEHRVEKPPLGGDAHGDSVKFTGTRPFTYSGEGKRGLALWPRRKYEISRDANPFPTGKGGGRPLPEAYGKLARAVETSRECQISKRSLQISVQINYYPRRSTCLSPSSLSLSLTRLCLRPSFSRWNPSLPRFHPLLSTFYEASLRIQTRQPSTSTTIHRRRLRRLTLLEMQRLRRMFENVFSPSFLLSLSLSFLRVYIYMYTRLAFPGKATPRDRWKSRDRLAARNVDEMLSCSTLSRTLRGDVYPTLLCLLRAGWWWNVLLPVFRLRKKNGCGKDRRFHFVFWYGILWMGARIFSLRLDFRLLGQF